MSESISDNGYFFFQCPSSRTFGYVSKKFWEENECLDDCDNLNKLEEAGIEMDGFNETSESFIEYDRSYQKGLQRLVELGFTEMENPWPDDFE